jgi:hypothetical protein
MTLNNTITKYDVSPILFLDDVSTEEVVVIASKEDYE